jgi:hypothetical protein
MINHVCIYTSDQLCSQKHFINTLDSIIGHCRQTIDTLFFLSCPTSKNDLLLYLDAYDTHINIVVLDQINKLKKQLQKNNVHDLFFIKSGIILPQSWDTRLKKIARSDNTIATISPVSNNNSIWNIAVDETEPEKIDELIFLAGGQHCTESPCPFHECFFITSKGLNFFLSILDQKTITSPEFFWKQTETMRDHGYPHVISANIYVHQQEKDRSFSDFLNTKSLVQSLNYSNPLPDSRTLSHINNICAPGHIYY